MKAAVTGASGHLGVNLLRSLIASGAEVRAVAHRNTTPLEALDVDVVMADVLDPESLDRAFEGTDVVFHLAAVISIAGDPTGIVHKVNVDGAGNAAEAALRTGVDRFVHCSSIHAFDMSLGTDVIDESSPRVSEGSPNHGAYDRSKADGERRVREVIATGLDGVIVHPTGVVGPWDHEPSRMGQFFQRVRDRRLLSLVSGGFDFVDARDVSIGMMSAAERGRTGTSYLLGGHPVSVTELAAMAGEAAGVRPPRLTLPRWMARLGVPLIGAAARIRKMEPLYTSESLDALALSSRIDHGLASRDLGYTVRPLAETVHDLYTWFDRD